MSLRWRIMGSIVLVIVLTVLISVSVGYYATQSRLGVFVDEIGDDEASRLARSLSREYTAAGGWGTVDRPLSEAGYIYDGVLERERHEESEGESVELFHQDPVRVVVADIDRRVVKDNLSELSPGTTAPDLDGHRETVSNLTTGQPVGHVYVDVNHEFLSTESHGLLNTLLYITAIGGTLTVWRCHTAGRLVVQTYHGAGDGIDRGNPGNCPGGYGPAASHVFGRAGADECGFQPDDLRLGNAARAPQAADKRRLP